MENLEWQRLYTGWKWNDFTISEPARDTELSPLLGFGLHVPDPAYVTLPEGREGHAKAFNNVNLSHFGFEIQYGGV